MHQLEHIALKAPQARIHLYARKDQLAALVAEAALDLLKRHQQKLAASRLKAAIGQIISLAPLIAELDIQIHAGADFRALGRRRRQQLLALRINLIMMIIKMIQADSIKDTAENAACYILKSYQRIFIMEY